MAHFRYENLPDRGLTKPMVTSEACLFLLLCAWLFLTLFYLYHVHVYSQTYVNQSINQSINQFYLKTHSFSNFSDRLRSWPSFSSLI